ncbi:MAG: PadR family transcriptional regulator [Actinobacteria bacterium]|nr:PadR family transcriptional regulator [Actinomycetota bacterium]MBU1943958.1 PadR family transcriptional regulator [Actinomycetota bacterium]MBU2686954.1 PadR family transcriptional regulator [Actinomycetota bacterium]
MKGDQGRDEGADPALMDHDRFVREGPQKGFVEPRLLCLIRKNPAYGYRLIEEIDRIPFPGPSPDSAAVYRMLRGLEKQGLVVSEWKHGESGPSKRVYTITPDGEKRLGAWRDALVERVAMLNRFISMCE